MVHINSSSGRLELLESGKHGLGGGIFYFALLEEGNLVCFVI